MLCGARFAYKNVFFTLNNLSFRFLVDLFVELRETKTVEDRRKELVLFLKVGIITPDPGH